MSTAQEGRRFGPLEARQALNIEVDGEPVLAYAGETVRIGFLHTTDNSGFSISTGWYIDDLTVVSKVP